MITKILDALKWFISKLTFKDWIILILIVLCGCFYLNYRHYYKESLTPIVVYSNDSLDMYKNKLNELYVSKDIYVQNIDDLLKEKNQLSQEIKKLKEHPVVITKTDIKVRIDTVKTESVEIINQDSMYSLKWRTFDNYYSLNGTTFVNSDFSSFTTQVDSFRMKANITLDILDNKNKLRIIGRTDNPYITITNMDGVVFDPTESKVLKKYYKQKRWSIGPYVGYGITTDGTILPSVGIGISYGIIKF